jgi:hypothetical protein
MPEPFASAEISTGERLSAEEEFDAISGRWVAAKDVLATGRLLKVLLSAHVSNVCARGAVGHSL